MITKRGAKMEVQIIRSNRRAIAIQVTSDLNIIVRAPYGVSKKQIDLLLKEKEAWIQKHLRLIKKRKEESFKGPKLSKEEVEQLAKEALSYIPKRVEYFAHRMQVDYRSITIRNQKTRWGSCSAKGGLNFNCLLMKMPPEIIDYVIVHELCHRKQMNHSKAFWNEVAYVLPNYKNSVEWLKKNGAGIMEMVF